MKKSQLPLFSLLFGCLVHLAGCAPLRLYPGPAKPFNQVARLRVAPDLWRFSIDDCNRPPKWVELLPGVHSYVVALWLCDYQPWAEPIWRWNRHRYPFWYRNIYEGKCLYTERVNLELSAVAGHQYWLGFELWIVDEAGARQRYRWPGLLSVIPPERVSCQFYIFDCTDKQKVAHTEAQVKSTSSLACPHRQPAGE